ncbi:unnamed protein product [Mycena citricolor]|uniref:Aminopeptidase n=1 Tax=Mycena citricolor TaxID=2018698 RepID=A0AAD2K430_9AGAR|nr:unnamed protein product [Mycena citricolor]
MWSNCMWSTSLCQRGTRIGRVGWFRSVSLSSTTPRPRIHVKPSLFCRTYCSPPTMDADLKQYRLPTNVKPLHYDLTVWTDLKALKFGGFVSIELDVRADTTTIELNTNDLQLGTASIFSDEIGLNEPLVEQTLDTSLQRVKYTLPKSLTAGTKAHLKIPFDASALGNSMTGYYRSAWEESGETKYYALTQFEAYARAAFPCWDEPALKATFAVTMISHKDTVNLSNMPALSEQPYQATGELAASLAPDCEWKITKFETTPLMSTYLVAFANGPFVYLEQSAVSPLSGRTIPLRIYSTPDLIHQAAFGLDVAAKVLPIYEQVFDIEYPLPKLDSLVASDFDAGAMEARRVNALLLDPAKADLRGKKNVAVTQSHEVAHQWFGNITTMSWLCNFDGRGHHPRQVMHTFSPWIVSHDVFRLFPEWKVNSAFISDHLQAALTLDAKLSSHPIEVECPDANHINQIFDSLSYSKAAAVLRMLSDYVGEEKFLKGVSLYLKKHLYGNTVTKDLFEGISTATGIDTVRLMDNWINKQGFPVLTVTETDKGILVRQDRFIETGHVEADQNETIWNIPLGILTATAEGTASVDKTAVLEEREKFFALNTKSAFKLNAGTSGVYRVLYSPERFAAIAAEAAKANSVFSLDDRMGLLYDVTALSKAGLAKSSDPLAVIEQWSNEQEYLVWSTIAGNLGRLVSVFSGNQKIVDTLRAFNRSLFVPLVKKLGYEYLEGEDLDVTQMRTLAIGAAMSARDQSVIDELKSRFSHYMESGDDSKIPADLEAAIYLAAARHGGRAEYDALVNILHKPKTPQSKISAIYALSGTLDPDLLKETFSLVLKSRDQDLVYYFRGLQSNSPSHTQSIVYLLLNAFQLMKRFEGNFTIKSLVSATFSSLSTEKDLAAAEEFFKDKDTSKYSMAIAQSLETIRTRIQYIERSSADLTEWLDKWEKRAKL